MNINLAQVPPDLRINVQGISELGLTLEAPSKEMPLDVALTNNGTRTVVAYMVLYEGILRDGYKGDYTGHLRDGNVFDRKTTGGNITALSQQDPAKRAALLTATGDVITPQTKWLIGLEGRMQRIDGDARSLVNLAREPSMFHDIANYKQINIMLNVALDDRLFYGPQASEFQVETHKSIEQMRKFFEDVNDESTEDSYHRLFESQLGGYYAKIQVVPGPDRLEIEDAASWKRYGLTGEDFNRLQSIGLTGTLKVLGCGSLGYPPHKARALIIGRQQIKKSIDLPQPDNCEVIYYQDGDEWKKFPADAPVLKKRFLLRVDPLDPDRTSMWTEAYEGSDAGGGGGAFTWENSSSSATTRSTDGGARLCRKSGGGGVGSHTTVLDEDGRPLKTPQPRADLRLSVQGLDEHGLILESAYGKSSPSHVVLTNNSEYYLMAYLIWYECILRDDMSEPDKARYGRRLRDGHVVDRWLLWAPIFYLGEQTPAERTRSLRSMEPTIAPRTKWVMGVGGSLQKIENNGVPTPEQSAGEDRAVLPDLAEYKQINITLDAIIENGETIGSHPERLQRMLQDMIKEREARRSMRERWSQ